MKRLLALTAILLALGGARSVFAEGSVEKTASGFVPSSAIDWVVTSSPGGGSDIYTRMIADIMTKQDIINGKTILVSNKTDGGGEVGRLTVSRVAKGKSADHTLLTFNSGDLLPMVKNTANRIENFTPIALMAVDQQLLFIGEMSKYKTFAEVISAVKAGKNVVVAGSKGDDYASFKMLIKELGFTETQLAFITNDATSGAITSILGGHVDLVMSKPAAADQYVAAGKLVPVLALSKTRFSGNLSSAPTLSELGSYNNIYNPIWRGVVGPKDMSPEAAKYWSDALKAVSESDAWKKDYLTKFKLESQFLNNVDATTFMSEAQAGYLKELGK
ncbi:tripartite tricarboxylate transporter substrate-binding protein [Treponema sp.]